MVFLIILLTVFALWFLKYIIELQLFKAKLKDFKCPPQTFLLGHLPALTSDILGATKSYVKTHGNLLYINVTFFAPVLFVSNHNVIKHILTSKTLINKGRIYDAFESLVPNTLALLSEKAWPKRRKLLNPVFSVQNVERWLSIFNSSTAILVDKIGKKLDQETEMMPLLELCTLDSTFELFLGKKLNSQMNENNVVNLYTTELHEIMRKKLLQPWTLIKFIYVFTPMYWRERAALKALSTETKSILSDYRSRMHQESTPFMKIILESDLDDSDIVSEITALMFESRDPVGTTVATALHLLAHHPKFQNKVVDELKTIFNNDTSRFITTEDLRELKYLEAVVKETMRLYPAAPFIARKFNEDQNIDGILVPANINVVICIHALQTSEEYFPEAEVFNPDRFCEDDTMTPFTYIPLSAGPRNCMGQKQGLCHIKVILAHILRRFELEPVGEEKRTMILTPAIMPITPFKIRFKPRRF